MRTRLDTFAGVLAFTALLLAAWRGGARGDITAPSFGSSGERIYFIATNEQGERVTYSGGPAFGRMGMMNARLTCASCHGADGRGGRHTMHMPVMDAPDIRWSTLASEGEHAERDAHEDAHAAYDLETFRLAVVAGQHPDGQSLSDDMPRWNLSDDDLADLMSYLQSLP